MFTLFYSIIIPLIVGSLVETLFLRLASRALKYTGVTWAHCFVFSFFSVAVALICRQVQPLALSGVGFTGLATLSLLLHAFLGALIFSRVPRAALPRLSNSRAITKRKPSKSSQGLQPIQLTLGPGRGSLLASIGFLSVASFFFVFGLALSKAASQL